jgi:glyceraldehyde 3-phosphate dehydrogenase
LESDLTMAIRVGINGFGRIGRLVLRAICDQGLLGKVIDVVAVVDVSTDVDYFAYLIKHDSVHGAFAHQVETVKGNAFIKEADLLIVNGHSIKCLAAPKELVRFALEGFGVDLVIESTGLFTDNDQQWSSSGRSQESI